MEGNYMETINVYKEMIRNCRKFPGVDDGDDHIIEYDDHMIAYITEDVYPNYTDEKYRTWPSYSYMMYDLYKSFSDTSSRAVMEQAFCLGYINKSSVITNTSIKKQKTDNIAVYYDNISYYQREIIETKMLEYETAIALVLKIYKTFMRTQDLICKCLANGDSKIDTDKTNKWIENTLNAIKLNDEQSIDDIETVLLEIKRIFEIKLDDNLNISDLYFIQWKLISISHCVYYDDSNNRASLLKKFMRWNEQLHERYYISETIKLINHNQVSLDDNRVWCVEDTLFYIPLELLSYRLYSYVDSFHDELKKRGVSV